MKISYLEVSLCKSSFSLLEIPAVPLFEHSPFDSKRPSFQLSACLWFCFDSLQGQQRKQGKKKKRKVYASAGPGNLNYWPIFTSWIHIQGLYFLTMNRIRWLFICWRSFPGCTVHWFAKGVQLQRSSYLLIQWLWMNRSGISAIIK